MQVASRYLGQREISTFSTLTDPANLSVHMTNALLGRSDHHDFFLFAVSEGLSWGKAAGLGGLCSRKSWDSISTENSFLK